MNITTLPVSSTWLLLTVIAILFMIIYPLVLAIIARRRLGIGWKYFWFGALVFLVTQLILRIPVITVLQATVLAPLLKGSTPFVWIWLFILALTAGIFEEVGRYLGYRIFMRREQKTWSKAIMYGIGHGGIESIVLVAGSVILSLINILALTPAQLHTLPAAQQQAVAQQLAALHAQPAWFSLLGAWERLWTLPFHIALSVVVLQVFQRNNIGWLFLAILLHTALDFVTIALQQVLGKGIGASLLIEGFIALAGLFAIWLIWRLRETGEPQPQAA